MTCVRTGTIAVLPEAFCVDEGAQCSVGAGQFRGWAVPELGDVGAG